jgi:metalloendopeptidase OMA1, mitochondrial
MTSSQTWQTSLVAGALALVAVACATTPYTNRTQFMVVSEGQEASLGEQSYRQVLAESKIETDPRVNEIVRRIGERIATAAERPDYQWEFVVIDDPKTVNAFALPGGKVAVYTGMFPVAQTEAGLATVMGHEVAHALARHGAERMSQQMGVQAVGTGLAVALGASGTSGITQSVAMQAFGLGAQVGVLLPFSRSQESEADHIGLILMAKAGYDPQQAVGFWERMEQNAGGKSPPEYLSTHPDHGTRVNQIQAWLPEAEKYYNANPGVTNKNLPGVG